MVSCFINLISSIIKELLKDDKGDKIDFNDIVIKGYLVMIIDKNDF